MTSSPPTLTGFNNNVRYRGMRFHIQTEDSGITRPHITTQLFADGGYVIKSLRTDYAEYVGHPERAVLVHRLMRDQHRAMALDLRDGKLDATIDRIAPAPADVASGEPLPDAKRGSDALPRSALPVSSLPISTPRPPITRAPVETGATLNGACFSSSITSQAPGQTPSLGLASADKAPVTLMSAALVAAAPCAAHAELPARIEGEPSDARAFDEATLRPPSEPRPAASGGELAVASGGSLPSSRVPGVPALTSPASSRRNARAAEAAASQTPSSRRSPSSRSPSSRAAATLRPPSSRNPQSSPRPPSSRAGQETKGAHQPASSKAATKHRMIPVGEAAPSKANPSADAANRAAAASTTTRRPSGSRGAATEHPPSTRKSPSSRGTNGARAPSSRSGSSKQRPSSRGGSSQRPASSTAATEHPSSSSGGSSAKRLPGPARAPSRPAFTAAAIVPSSKPVALARPVVNRSSNAQPPNSRAATSSKRSPAALSNPPTPSSRRAGRPSPVLTPPKGSKSLFSALPQESLDDAILSFAATVKNGPPTRGSK